MPRSVLRGGVPRDADEKAAIRRKNLNIDQNKLDRAVEILGARSETEAVDRALDLLVFREELLEGLRRIGGTGGVVNFFDEHP